MLTVGPSPVAEDLSGDHDASIHGAAWTAEGKYGSALEFDGENDLLTIPDSEALDFTEGFTLEAWVRPSEAHPWAPLFTKEHEGATLHSARSSLPRIEPIAEVGRPWDRYAIIQK